MKAASTAREAARLVALRRLRQRRAEIAHGEALVRTAQASEAADAAEAEHRAGEEAWEAAMAEPRLALALAGAWGTLLRDSHAGAEEAARTLEDAVCERDGKAADAGRAAAETELVSEMADRLARRSRRAGEERALAAYEDGAGARGRRR